MTTHQTTTLLLALAAIALLSFGAGTLARRLGQPPVIGEIALGVLLGPTLLHGAIADALFPADIRPFLTALAHIGVALFMFTIGAELDARLLRGRTVVTATVASGSIALPFALGSVLALHLFAGHPTGNKTAFVLFMGAAMSVTAFPVLARILTDRGMHRTWLGNVALACASIDDVLAWTLLAVVVAISGEGTGSQWLLLLFVPYVTLMVTAVRAALRRLLSSPRVLRSRQSVPLVITLVGLLLSAAFTEWIGLHFIFGAFLFGAIMPRGVLTPQPAGPAATVHDAIIGKISHLNGILLLPIFFIVAGLKVNLSGMNGRDVADLALILAVAIGGKFLGAYLGARLNGMRSRPATALAVLMNTRGLTELIILTIGLDLGVLDGELYSSMVIMALVTTALAGPLLHLLYPRPVPDDAPPAPDRRERRHRNPARRVG